MYNNSWILIIITFILVLFMMTIDFSSYPILFNVMLMVCFGLFITAVILFINMYKDKNKRDQYEKTVPENREKSDATQFMEINEPEIQPQRIMLRREDLSQQSASEINTIGISNDLEGQLNKIQYRKYFYGFWCNTDQMLLFSEDNTFEWNMPNFTGRGNFHLSLHHDSKMQIELSFSNGEQRVWNAIIIDDDTMELESYNQYNKNTVKFIFIRSSKYY
ncbi:MAG: hypothetical protein ACOWWR_17715 [Eubacteriales bacterium]